MLSSLRDISDDDKKIIEKVRGRFSESKQMQDQYRPQWETWYSLYRSYRKASSAYQMATTERDRDEIVRAQQKEMGMELFIPMAFAIVETVLPRILSNDPKMLALPNNPAAEKSTEPVKRLFERDQAAMNYEMKLQGPARSGLIYGLGVQKNWWEEKYRDGKSRTHKWGTSFFTRKDKKLISRGNQAESVDIWDFFWDPGAFDMESSEYVIHRTWRSTQYIMDRVAQGQWIEMNAEFVNGMGSDSGRNEVWSPRYKAGGLAGYDSKSNRMHEVLEYHDRDNVYTLLDGQVLVQNEENPFHHGDLPFAIFRPTIIPHEFVGIGVVEPVAHLNAELNDIRTKRRQAGELALHPAYFYSRGMIDPADAVTGAGAFIPVLGDPTDVVRPVPFSEPPASSFNEEAALKNDIDRTSGISEEVAGTGETTSSDTATGTQLKQAAADQRIKQQAKNLNKELIRRSAAQWLENYRQNITKSEDVRIEDPSTPTGWNWIKVKPKDLAANLEVVPEAGATEPENPAQKRQDVGNLVAALGPFGEQVDTKKLIEHILTEFGIVHPEQWLIDAPEEEEIPPGPGAEMPPGEVVAPIEDQDAIVDTLMPIIGDYLVKSGFSEEVAEDLLVRSYAEAQGAPPPEPPPAEEELVPA